MMWWPAIIVLALSWMPEARALEIVDDIGQRVVLDAPADRIIALYGAYNEILGAMGLENRIVGRTKADRMPPSILSKPSIGTHMRPNIEIILGLRPDLALQSSGRKEALASVQQIQSQGLPVAVFRPKDFSDLFSVIRRIGILTGEQAKAEDLVRSLNTRLQRVEQRLHGITRRSSVFFEVRYPNLLGAGRGSIVNDIIRHAGGINCIGDQKKLVRMNMEALIEKDPDAYIIQQGPMNKEPSNPSDRPHFHILKAIKNGKILFVDEQIYSRPGPRSVDAVEELAAFLHPERFRNQ